MNRITEKQDNGFYTLAKKEDLFKTETEIALVQIVGKIEDLEEELGCPLEVRCKVVCDSYIYDDDGNEYKVDYVYKNNFVCHNGQCDDFGCDYEFTFNWNDYKKIWFFKKG